MIYKYDWATSHTTGPLPEDDRNCHPLRDAIAAAKQAASGELQDGGRAYITVREKLDIFDVLDEILVYAAYTYDGRSWHQMHGSWYGEPIYRDAEARIILRAQANAYKHS